MSSKIFSIPRGILTEISGPAGSGKTEAVLRFLAQNPSIRVAWLEAGFSVYPCAFPQNGVDLKRVFFVDATEGNEKTALWAAHQILNSQIFGALVLSVPIREMVALRRLQLAAEKTQAAIILLPEIQSPGSAWPIGLQLKASRSVETGELELNVLRNKGGHGWHSQSA